MNAGEIDWVDGAVDFDEEDRGPGVEDIASSLTGTLCFFEVKHSA